MKTFITAVAFSIIAISSIEYYSHDFVYKEFFKAKLHTIKDALAQTEHKALTAEQDFEILLEGASNGIN